MSPCADIILRYKMTLVCALDIHLRYYESFKEYFQPAEVFKQILDEFVLSKGAKATLGCFIDALNTVNLRMFAETLEEKIKDYEKSIAESKREKENNWV